MEPSVPPKQRDDGVSQVYMTAMEVEEVEEVQACGRHLIRDGTCQ